ncbi:MAG: hypothetical protein IKO41_14120 [Lachnospiraceae bacterium]|nr:hypothetical protein [Lachnospiraceae bacterium]
MDDVKEFSKLDDHARKVGKIQFDRKISDVSLILRYCNIVRHMDYEVLQELLGQDAETMRKLFYGFKNKVPIETFDNLCAKLNLDYLMLLSYARDWKDNRGIASTDLPFPIRLQLSDGTESEERFWFQNGWFEQNFGSTENVSVFRLADNSLATYGFSRGDVVLASRLPEHVIFMSRHVYMVKERDGCIYPRVAEVFTTDTVSGGNTRILCNPLDKSDHIPFSPLPENFVMIGRLVWKCGFI